MAWYYVNDINKVHTCSGMFTFFSLVCYSCSIDVNLLSQKKTVTCANIREDKGCICHNNNMMFV